MNPKGHIEFLARFCPAWALEDALARHREWIPPGILLEDTKTKEG